MSVLHPRSRALAVAAVVVLAACTAACTDTSAAPEPPVADQRAAEPSSVALRTEVARVVGDLPPHRRQRVRTQVDAVMQRYLDAAFLRDEPSASVGSAFAAFTRGARALAEKDVAVLTGREFQDADRVTAQAAKAELTVVAPRGGAVGTTARITLRLQVRTEDKVTRKVTVKGRLLLTPTRQGWRIFGYHVVRSGGVGATS